MITDNILDFLQTLSENNNREWFAEHRDWYERTWADFGVLTQELINRIGTFDPEVRHLQARDCVYRIYRDTRFSPDKTPYKRHLAAYIAAPVGRRSDKAGYYVHIEPGNSLFAAGYWTQDSDMIRAMRQSIFDNYEELEEIMQNEKFRRAFADMDTDYMLKTVPAGFPRDFIHADWLKRKSFTISHNISNAEVRSDRFVPTVESLARLAVPYNRFFNYSIDEVRMA